MAFCTNCGQQMFDGAKFCASCGNPVNQINSSTDNERKTVFDGEIHKCPRCGEVLSHRDLICPTCSYELRDIKESKMMLELKEKLSKALTETEQIVIIRSFPIPRTKEGLSELSKWAASNFDADFSASHQTVDDVSDAYYSMLKKCYLQAADLLDNTSQDFLNIKNIYDTVELEKNKKYREFLNREKKKNKKPFRVGDYFPYICAVGILVVLLTITLIALNFFGVINLNKNKTNIGVSSNKLIEMDYITVEEIFESKGFDNISVKLLEWNSMYSVNEIVYVAIDGEKYFSKFKKFSKESNITIYINDTPKKISIGYSYKDIIGQNYQDITEKLKAKGFQNIRYNTFSWSPNEISEAVKKITINGVSEFDLNTEFSQDSNITIDYNLQPQFVSIGYSSGDLKSLTSAEIENILKAKGFVYISVELLEWDNSYDIGETIYLTVDGDKTFYKKTEFSQDSKIVIYVNGTPKSIKVGYNSAALIGRNYKDVEDLLEQQGFKNIETIEDGWNLFHKSETIKSITINGASEFVADSVYLQDAIIKIYYYK